MPPPPLPVAPGPPYPPPEYGPPYPGPFPDEYPKPSVEIFPPASTCTESAEIFTPYKRAVVFAEWLITPPAFTHTGPETVICDVLAWVNMPPDPTVKSVNDDNHEPATNCEEVTVKPVNPFNGPVLVTSK